MSEQSQASASIGRDAQPAVPLSIDQLLSAGSLAGIEAPTWTPDGSSVVAASPIGGATELWAFPFQGGAPQRLTTGMGSVGHLASALPRWSPDGRYLCYITGDIGQTEVWVQPADGSPPFPLTRIGANITGLAWTVDSASVLVAANRTGTYDIFRVALADGRHDQLTSDARYEVQPVASPDGEHLVYVRLDETWTQHDVLVAPLAAADRADRAAKTRTLVHDENFFDYQYGGGFGRPVISPDGQTVLFRSYRSDWINLWAVPFDGGEPHQIDADAADQDGATFSPDGKWIAYTSNQDASIQIRIVPTDGSADPRVVVDPGDGVCMFPAFSPDGTRLAFTMIGATHPAEVCVVDIDSGEVTRLTRSVPATTEARLATPERVSFAGHDGLQIPAFLYRPESAGVAPNGAGVVNVHGGPTMQWFPMFDGYTQFLVLQGYTVLLPNIRGSAGYGRAFEEANDRDWCGGDLLDVRSGADFLRGLDSVDPDKLAVTGLSYGGIMSMAATCFAPGEFQAAASLSGYGDFLDMMDEQEFRHQQLLRKELGDPVEDRDIYVKASSILAVKDATTPILIAHGVGRFPESDAGEKFALALQREYKTYRYVTYPDEHYYVMGKENLRSLWREVDSFFRTYLDL